MKYCPRCKETKPLSAWSPKSQTMSGRPCRLCFNAEHLRTYHANKEHFRARSRGYEDRDIALYLLKRALERARKYGLSFTITKADVIVPEFCPVLGLRLRRGRGRVCDGSPTLDRLRPELGYVPGNVAVLSYRANRMKNDGTLQEIKALVLWMRQHYAGVDSAAKAA